MGQHEAAAIPICLANPSYITVTYETKLCHVFSFPDHLPTYFWQWYNICHKNCPALSQQSRYLVDISCFSSSLNASVIKKWHGFWKTTLKKIFDCTSLTFFWFTHLSKGSLLNMAVFPNSSSFLGHLLGNDQDHRVEELYRPLFETFRSHRTIPAHSASFSPLITASGQLGR